MEAERFETREWPFFERGDLPWVVLTLVFVLLAAGYLPEASETSGTTFRWALALIAGLALLTESVQYLALRWQGAKPYPGLFPFWRRRSALGTLVVGVEGCFTRREVFSLCLVPFVVSLLVAGSLLIYSSGTALFSPVLLFLAAELRHPVTMSRVLLWPEGTLFEETKRGTRIHTPPPPRPAG